MVLNRNIERIESYRATFAQCLIIKGASHPGEMNTHIDGRYFEDD